eukprot:s1489_g11.t1
MIKFILMVNKQGQTRLAQYYEFLSVRERVTLEGELIRKCLSRSESQCSFVEYRDYRVVYRRYASLYFIVGIDNDEDCNELAILEFIHTLVETLDKYFENVCELDIMCFHVAQVTSRITRLGRRGEFSRILLWVCLKIWNPEFNGLFTSLLKW